MQMHTLVLNSAYMPINKITWRKAISLLFTGKVEVIEEYDEIVRSPSTAFQMPSIIRYLGAKVGMFRRGVKFNRNNVYLRDKGRCQYCGKRVSREDFTYDHIVPRRHGGETKWKNIVVSCIPCNQRKAARTPEQAGMRLISKPVRPKYLPGVSSPILNWSAGMPTSWKDYMGSVKYWHDKLA